MKQQKYKINQDANIVLAKKIPEEINLTTADPFLTYIVNIYNSGVYHMTYANALYNEMKTQQEEYNGYMQEYRLSEFLEK